MILTQDLAGVTLQKSEENVTGKMGLSWIGHCMKHFGIEETIKEIFPKKKSNREIDAWNKILTGSLMMIAGGQRIEDIENLRADTPLINSLGWKSMISPDTFLNFLENKRNINQLLKVNDEISIKAMKQSPLKEFTFDSDATYFDSEKDCAQYSYKKSRQMSALLGFIPELSGLCITADYRSGNESPAKGILEQLKHAVSLAKKAGKRIKKFRHDSAAHNMEVFKYCEAENIKYYVSIDKNKVIKETLQSLNADKWSPLEGQDNKVWAESLYCQMKNKKDKITTRIMALRWINPKPQLFDTSPYCYHVIGTNDWDIDPMEWLDFHNGRMNSENYNKEIKFGFSGDYTPSHDFTKSCNYFLVGILAYNMIQLMKLYYLGKDAVTWTIKTLRYWFIETCGNFVKHSRIITCKIRNVTNLTFMLFENCLSKLIYNQA